MEKKLAMLDDEVLGTVSGGESTNTNNTNNPNLIIETPNCSDGSELDELNNKIDVGTGINTIENDILKSMADI